MNKHSGLNRWLIVAALLMVALLVWLYGRHSSDSASQNDVVARMYNEQASALISQRKTQGHFPTSHAQRIDHAYALLMSKLRKESIPFGVGVEQVQLNGGRVLNGGGGVELTSAAKPVKDALGIRVITVHVSGPWSRFVGFMKWLHVLDGGSAAITGLDISNGHYLMELKIYGR